jgi:hypothetical protein
MCVALVKNLAAQKTSLVSIASMSKNSDVSLHKLYDASANLFHI